MFTPHFVFIFIPAALYASTSQKKLSRFLIARYIFDLLYERKQKTGFTADGFFMNLADHALHQICLDQLERGKSCFIISIFKEMDDG